MSRSAAGQSLAAVTGLPAPGHPELRLHEGIRNREPIVVDKLVLLLAHVRAYEGPAQLTHPNAATTPPVFTAYLRQPLQTVLSTTLSSDPAVADDAHVLKFLLVRREANAQTYTMFRAVGIGTTTVRAQRWATVTTPAAALRLTVCVLCHQPGPRPSGP